MSEKLDKLRASLEKERERRIKINTRIESLERRIQEAEAVYYLTNFQMHVFDLHLSSYR